MLFGYTCRIEWAVGLLLARILELLNGIVDCMIAKEHRFHGRASLGYVYRQGRTVRGPLCAIKYAPSKRPEGYRMAVVVSKKVHKSAVVRNRIRRRLYEAVRRQEPRITQPFDMVCTVFSPAVADIPADQIDRLVFAQLHQAGILRAA